MRCTFAIALYQLAGCGPSVVLAPPPEWPAEWRGRRLFHTPQALIYATSDAAAGHADRLIAAAPNSLSAPAANNATTSQPGATHAKGLVIVMDRDDGSLFDDPAGLFAVFMRGQAQMAGQPPPSDQEIVKGRERLDKLGPPLATIFNDLLAMMPVPIAPRDVRDTFAFPADAEPVVDWAGILPTAGLIQTRSTAVADALINGAMATENVPVAARWLVKPMMPMIRGALAQEIVKQRDASFADIVRQNDPEWLADRAARARALKAWDVVRSAARTTTDYAIAHERVRSAAERLPNDANVLRVLAAAQYRTCDYAGTIATLDRVVALDRQRVSESAVTSLGLFAKQMAPAAGGQIDAAIESAAAGRPSDLAFRAMALHRLGKTDDAVAVWERISKLIAESRVADSRDLLLEAASVLGQQAPPTTQPATQPSSL